MITFEVKGRKVSQKQFFKSIEKNVHDAVKDHLVQEVNKVRDPETGEKPSVKVSGNSLDDLCVEVTGSGSIIEEVKNKLSN